MFVKGCRSANNAPGYSPPVRCHRRWRRCGWFRPLLTLLLLTACTTPLPMASPTPEATPLPTPTTTPEPVELPQQLVLCTTEPEAVSPFLSSRSSQDLLALFYEEPIERINYRWEPRLVERVPSPEAGDVSTRPAPVATGMQYVDDVGLLRLHGDGEPLQLPQLVVTFTLKSDLLWSDGTPITSRDAVLGYHLAQAPQAEGRWRDLAERTASFVAVDDYTLRWEGIPGYLDSDYPGFLFPLQPSHRWQGQTLTAILNDRTPLANGVYRISAWEAHREVRLVPNPHYSGPGPALETVIVRFPQQKPDRWASLLIDGTCDVILPDPILATSWQQWTELGALGEAVVWADIATTVLRLDLNLDPESRTGSSEGAIAATPLQEAQIREALDLCIDRERLTQLMPAEALIPAGGFVPPNHPAHGGASPVYDPDQAKDLLDGAGWRDGDRDKFREAVDAPGFEPGTPLEFTIQFAPQYFVIAAHIAADLETCGIKANLEPTTVNQLYTAGATSPLFGRRFESVLLGWHAEVPQVCGGWLSDRIPDEDNDWTGENFSGYVSEAYDAACKQALTAVELEQEVSALGRAQQLLQQDRPTLFLAWRPFWFAARPEVQGLKPDASAYSTIWNIEEIHIASSDIEE